MIGLITFLSYNYGTCLQAFAMKKALERQSGEDVFFVNFERSGKNAKSTTISKILSCIKRYSFRELLEYRKYTAIRSKRTRKFKDFLKLIISDDIIYHEKKELSALGDNFHSNDILVCGSDMIWSTEYQQYLDIYMLTWCGKARKVSYAPSIGNVDIAPTLQRQYSAALNSFSYLSCREKSGARYLEKLLDIEVPVVLDPTMLFDKKQWLQWFPNKPHDSSLRPYILVYCFGGLNTTMHKQLDTLAHKNGMDVRYLLSPSVLDTIHELRYGDGAYGPAEYLQLFFEASFTVVNGYHGLLFSLIFEKPFVLLHREKKEHWGAHENRMLEMLEMLHLEDRYIDFNDLILEKHFSLDYINLRNLIEEKRKMSWNYLKEALR